MSETKTQLVTIEKPIYGGAFLARVEGKAVFVPMALPGEQALVRIVEDKRSYATAELVEIEAPHAAVRVVPGCRHFGACGGCQYQHADYKAQQEFKQAILRETLERGGVAVPPEIETLAGEPWGYRNRIRVAFDAAGRMGYRGRRSHGIVPIEECPIAAPVLVRAALAFRDLLRTVPATLRPAELSLFCNADESTLLASIFVTRPVKIRLDELAAAWQKTIPGLAGVEIAVEGNKNQPERTMARWGAPSLTYTTGGFAYRVDHGSFFQVNRWLVDALVERVAGNRSGQLAWDLFAGVGLFARKLGERFERVVAVESAPPSVDALKANLFGTSGEAVQVDTLGFLRRHKGQGPELIVVDPPRAGLGPEATAELARIGAPTIIYVSCDPATLARDLRSLTGASYVIDRIALADLFPQTFHLETVVELRRA